MVKPTADTLEIWPRLSRVHAERQFSFDGDTDQLAERIAKLVDDQPGKSKSPRDAI